MKSLILLILTEPALLHVCKHHQVYDPDLWSMKPLNPIQRMLQTTDWHPLKIVADYASPTIAAYKDSA